MTTAQRAQFPDGIRVFKYHALGNSYLIVDPRNCRPQNGVLDVGSDGQLQLNPGVARILCEQTRGIGSNGLLFGPLEKSNATLFQLRIVNSDGTSAGFSGNGVRIFGKYLLDAGYIQKGQRISIEITETDNSGVSTSHVAPVHLIEGQQELIEVTVPHAPKFGGAATAANPEFIQANDCENLKGGLSHRVIPINAIGSRMNGSSTTWSCSTLVDIGNPHCVTFINDDNEFPDLAALQLFDEALRDIAFRPDPARRTLAPFANGTNLQWARVRNRSLLDLMIYERGEGPTTASGSSASAAASAAFIRGLVDATVDVSMPGGILSIRIDGTPDAIRSVTLSGSATRILDGWINPAILTAI